METSIGPTAQDAVAVELESARTAAVAQIKCETEAESRATGVKSYGGYNPASNHSGVEWNAFSSDYLGSMNGNSNSNSTTSNSNSGVGEGSTNIPVCFPLQAEPVTSISSHQVSPSVPCVNTCQRATPVTDTDAGTFYQSPSSCWYKQPSSSLPVPVQTITSCAQPSSVTVSTTISSDCPSSVSLQTEENTSDSCSQSQTQASTYSQSQAPTYSQSHDSQASTYSQAQSQASTYSQVQASSYSHSQSSTYSNSQSQSSTYSQSHSQSSTYSQSQAAKKEGHCPGRASRAVGAETTKDVNTRVKSGARVRKMPPSRRAAQVQSVEALLGPEAGEVTEQQSDSVSLAKKLPRASSAERMEKTTRRLGARQSSRLQQQQTDKEQTAASLSPIRELSPSPHPEQEPEMLPPASRQLRQRRMTRKPRHTQRLWRPDIQGAPVDRWRTVGQREGLSSDTEIAVFLMGHYEDVLSGRPTTGASCTNCHAPLTLTCLSCRGPSQFTDPPKSSLNPAATDAARFPSLKAVTEAIRSVLSSVSDAPRSATNTVGSPDLAEEAGGEGEMVVEAKTEPLEAPSDGETETELEVFQMKEEEDEEEEEEGREVLTKKRKKAGCPKRGRPVGSDNLKNKGKPRKYKCTHEGCEAAFAKSSRLKIHQRIHTGEKPYVCKDCDKAFTQKSGLTVHSQKHTGLKPYKCEECGSAFPSSSTLKQHMRRHTGEKPFRCKKCPKTFRWSGHLTQHMRAHDGIKPFLCPDCGKAFSASSDLAKHRVTHTKSRPYKCDQCHKAYAFQHRLTAHQRSHTGDRPFLCQECGAAFARAHNLTVHIRTHTGDKPYWCQDCGAKFSDSGNFCKHKKTKHGAAADHSKNPKSHNTSFTAATNPSSLVKLPECDRLLSMADLADTGKLPSMAKVARDAKREVAGMLDFMPVGSVAHGTAMLQPASLTSAASLSSSSSSSEQQDMAELKRLLPPMSGGRGDQGSFEFPSHLNPPPLPMASPPPPPLPHHSTPPPPHHHSQPQHSLPSPHQSLSASPALSPAVSHLAQGSPGPGGSHDGRVSISPMPQPQPQPAHQMGDYHSPQHDGVVFPPHYPPAHYAYYYQQQQQ